MELINNIETLLDKYFDGDTTLQEEKILQNYFLTKDVPEHLEQYKAMFAYFAQNKKETAPKDLPIKSKNTTWFKNAWIGRVAVVLLLFALAYTFIPKGISDAEKKEAQIAFLQTQKALELISKNLNKGNHAVLYLDEFESSKKKIFKDTY